MPSLAATFGRSSGRGVLSSLRSAAMKPLRMVDDLMKRIPVFGGLLGRTTGIMGLSIGTLIVLVYIIYTVVM